jgi:hypothetical protein
MTSLLARLEAFFFEGAESSPASRQDVVPQSAGDEPLSTASGGASRAAVLGAPGVVVPVAAACAGELRARERAAAALLCIWRPGEVEPEPEPESDGPAVRSPAGATTPGARRLAGRLATHELGATACGRLAWLALEREAAAAAGQVRRCLALARAPLVLAVAGPRPAALEPLLAEFDLAIAVLAPDTDPALRELAVATLTARRRHVVAPLAPGPPRWAAMAGLARLRALPRAEA